MTTLIVDVRDELDHHLIWVCHRAKLLTLEQAAATPESWWNSQWGIGNKRIMKIMKACLRRNIPLYGFESDEVVEYGFCLDTGRKVTRR